MKKKLVATAVIALLTLASCKDKAENTTFKDNVVSEPSRLELLPEPDAVPENVPLYEAVSGKVTAIVNGKDGYAATILNKRDSIVYDVVISSPNLKNPKEFRQVKVGDELRAIGEQYEVGERHTIKASTLE